MSAVYVWQDMGVLCRAATLAYLAAEPLEIIYDGDEPDLNDHIQQAVEDFAHRHLAAWIHWTYTDTAMVGEFTPNLQGAPVG